MYEARRNPDENSFSVLRKNTGIITCDFCDMTFKNRYKSIIHNAYHIVIPLIKQEVHQCPDCLYYFTSLSNLKNHIQSNHTHTYEIKGTHTYVNKDIHTNETKEIKSEPEDDYNDIILYNYEVNVNMFNTSNTDFKQSVEEYILPDVCVSQIQQNCNEKVVDNVENVNKSVHYDKLILPGVFKCQYCHMCFPNRLKLIEHGTIHIQFKKTRPLLCTICDMYIAGNHYQLSKHVAEKHPFRTDRPRSKTTCTICGLKYHKYVRHLVNYHSTLIKLNDNSIPKIAGDKSTLGGKPQSCDLSNATIFNICQICLPFLKKKINIKYIIVGNINEIGVRHKCFKCHKLFFDITLVKRITSSGDNVNLYGSKKKPKTNRERLKNIQMRMKMINKLSKIYVFFFLLRRISFLIKYTLDSELETEIASNIIFITIFEINV